MPVNEALLTLRKLDSRTLTSAGTLSPALNYMISPLTKYYDSIICIIPSRITETC